jgi:hypothetical protein
VRIACRAQGRARVLRSVATNAPPPEDTMPYTRLAVYTLAACTALPLIAAPAAAATPFDALFTADIAMPHPVPYASRIRRGWLAPAARKQKLIYVSDFNASAVEIYPQGQSNPAPVGQIVAGISGPLGNFVDAKGTLYVANSLANTVTEYADGSLTPTATLSTDLSGPISVAVDKSGDVAVGEFASGIVYEFAAGTSAPAVTITLLSRPEALAYDTKQRLYAAWNVDLGSGLAGHVSRCLRMQATCVDQGIVEGESGGLALDAAGNVVLGDQTNHVIDVFALGTSAPLRTIPTPSRDPYKFELDRKERTLYVADIANNVVATYDYTSGAQTGTIASGLTSAWGVSLSPAAKDGP